ncbi:MAG: alpha-glucan family phosphorylase, partial [Myxococcota bacterium]|nr:alpha-glucan family phosphorylase [Myxococcota bacterium]
MSLIDDLHSLAHDLWWTGQPRAHALWPALDPALWEAVNHNPVALLDEAGLTAVPDEHAPAAARLVADWKAMRSTAGERPVPSTAYFCMEYGLHESLPIYSGGLGMLAGDHVRSASDLGLDFVAVGLFWHEGYFRQLVHDGAQVAAYAPNRLQRLAIRPALGPDGARARVSVPCGGVEIHVEAWEVTVGRVKLYLLDTDVEGNRPEHRALTLRLYGGQDGNRILQEVVLGMGGLRMLRALGISPDVFHMNEGHAAFLTFELWSEGLLRGEGIEEAWDKVAPQCVFTTHTPVPAGHDRFRWDEVDPILGTWRHQLGLYPGAFMDRGRIEPGNVDEPLCMTVLGIRGSRSSNGVSALHGEVSRQMWADLGLPITHITNGVHAGAWLAPETEALWDEHIPGWQDHLADAAWWRRAEDIPDAAMLAHRDAKRTRLVAEVRRRTGRDVLDPSLPTIGFARRFATYKRGDLIFRDPDRLAAILEAGAQLVFAGKAHPADIPGQQVVANVLRFSRDPRFRDRVVFLPDYDMSIGRLLTGYCDVWLNNPRRPREASGTSGQKSAMNGNLNCSVLDGWWPEAYDGSNGWAVGEEREYADLEAQDAADAEHLYSL